MSTDFDPDHPEQAKENSNIVLFPDKAQRTENERVAKTIDYSKPAHHVYCVQSLKDGVLQGVCFYESQAKAHYITKLMKEKYAELDKQYPNDPSKFTAVCISYPVY